MIFLSQLLGLNVVDAYNAVCGRVKDIVAAMSEGRYPPEIVAVQVKRGDQLSLIPMECVAALVFPTVALSRPDDDLPAYALTDRDLLLGRDVLDKQIIDTDGARVVRVNDLELARINDRYFVINVDIGYMGICRRLGLPAALVKWVGKRTGRAKTKGIISWGEVELLPGGKPVRLKVPSDRLSDLHPADLAEILSDLNRTDSSLFLESLDVKTAADALEEVEPDFQASLVESIPDEKVADILEEMAPDEAADLLAELPEDRSRELLNLMEREEADDVRRLLAYAEDTAGGIMTTEYVAIPRGLVAQDAISLLRESAVEAETIFYVYVTDEEKRLHGVFSLSDLILSPPETPVESFMHRRMVSVRLEDGQEKVAQIIAKYNLLAVPVVDDEGRIEGIVTADDALDKIIPTKWKKHLPRIYR